MADSMQPNPITVDDQGRIGADFTGHVHAQGLDLDAGISATPPSDDRIRWIRQSDGGLIAELYGYSDPASNLSSFNQRVYMDPGHFGEQAFRILNANGTVCSELRLEGKDADPTSTVNVARIKAGAQTRFIVTGDGLSSFVQLAAGGLGPTAIDTGQRGEALAAANSTVDVIGHALGRVPIAVFAVSSFVPGHAVVCHTDTYTANDFRMTAVVADLAPITANFTVTYLVVG